MDAANHTFTCPLCAKNVKVTKTGKIARHGHRRMYGAEWNHCPTSGLKVTEALHRAVEVLTDYRELTAEGFEITMSGQKRKIFDSLRDAKLRSIDRDLAAIAERLAA